MDGDWEEVSSDYSCVPTISVLFATLFERQPRSEDADLCPNRSIDFLYLLHLLTLSPRQWLLWPLTRVKNSFGLGTIMGASRASTTPSSSGILHSKLEMAPFANCCSMIRALSHLDQIAYIWRCAGGLHYGI